MKVLVTGATGFLGTHLVKRLLDEGCAVTVFVREHRLAWPFQDKVQVVNGDLNQIDETIITILTGHDLVFHLAGFISYRPKDYSLLLRINTDATLKLYEACYHAGVKKFVFVSSVAAIGALKQPIVLSESDQVDLRGPAWGYFESKRLAEEGLKRAYFLRGLPCYWINPTTVYGAGDYVKGSRQVQKKVATGQFRWYPPGGVNVVSVDDVVEALIQVWQKGQPVQRYIVGAENITIKTLFEWIQEVAGVKKRLLPIPRWALHAIAISGKWLQNRLNVSLPGWAHYAELAQLYHWYDGSKAAQELGIRYRSAKEAVTESVKDFLRTLKNKGYN